MDGFEKTLKSSHLMLFMQQKLGEAAKTKGKQRESDSSLTFGLESEATHAGQLRLRLQLLLTAGLPLKWAFSGHTHLTPPVELSYFLFAVPSTLEIFPYSIFV